MTEKYTMGVEVNMNTRQQTSTAKAVHSSVPETKPDSPFCIAILGDFTGRANTSLELSPLSDSRLIEIDRDNLEEVMARLSITLNLKLSDQQNINIAISEMDDFHPDELYDKLDSFAELRSLRRRLKSTKTFPQAAAEMQTWSGVSDSSQQEQAPDASDHTIDTRDGDAGDLLSDILDSQQGDQQQNNEASQINQLIRSIVAPYVEPATDPRQGELLSVLDKATEKHMQDILHHEVFQQIESAWLSLSFLVRRLETGAKLKLFILDISKLEFENELRQDDIDQSLLFKRFCNPAEGEQPWSVIVGNYEFSDNVEDIQTIGRMGEIAQAAKAPFISSVSAHFAGCEAIAKTPDYEDWNYTMNGEVIEAWEDLRSSSVASYIGLALPRFLLRLPYGEKARQVEVFDFEELPASVSPLDNHENYLWGNAAILKAELLARAFMQKAWDMQPGEVHQVDKLPLHYYEDEGESVNKPAAEVYLTEKAGEKMTLQGLMPLWSVKNMDAVRSADFRSINAHADKLSGRWNKI